MIESPNCRGPNIVSIEIRVHECFSLNFRFEKMKPQWGSIPDLATQEIKLRQKISLLCLMEVSESLQLDELTSIPSTFFHSLFQMTFKRPSDHRSIKFEEIATETKLPLKEVEILIMKALAQGLVKGAIDQVSGVVNMTWV